MLPRAAASTDTRATASMSEQSQDDAALEAVRDWLVQNPIPAAPRAGRSTKTPPYGIVPLAAEMPTQPLRQRRVLLVDDTLELTESWLHCLRDAGATALWQRDGATALSTAHLELPDLLIIGELSGAPFDGLALCRALSRDVILAELPILFTSSRPELLQRICELHPGIRQCLPKQTALAAIVEAARHALQERHSIERELAQHDQVRGYVESIGMPVLLRLSAAHASATRLQVQDACSLFEVSLAQGKLLKLSRTFRDGSFLRGEEAAMSLLGCACGWFTLQGMENTPASLNGEPVGAWTTRTGKQLSELLLHLRGAALAEVARFEMHPDVLQALRTWSPTSWCDAVTRLSEGGGPQTLLRQAEIEPADAEMAMHDLARQGALLALYSAGGQVLWSAVAAGATSNEANPPLLRIDSPTPSNEPATEDAVATLPPPRSMLPELPFAGLGTLPLASAAVLFDDARTIPPAAVKVSPARLTEPAVAAAPPEEEPVAEPVIAMQPTAAVANALPRWTPAAEDEHDTLSDEPWWTQRQRRGRSRRLWWAALLFVCGAAAAAIWLAPPGWWPVRRAARPTERTLSAAPAPRLARQMPRRQPADSVASWQGLRFGVHRPWPSAPTGQGILAIRRPAAQAPEISVRIGELGWQPLPVELSLLEGRYELVFRFSGKQRVRYVHVPSAQRVLVDLNDARFADFWLLR